MDRGPFGLISSIVLFGSVLLVMILSAREGAPDAGPQLPQPRANTTQAAPQNSAPAPSNVVEEAVAKLKLVWAALDGRIDEAEIRRIASEWKDATQNQVIPQLNAWGRRLQDGQAEQLAQEALDALMRESAPVRMRVMEEFGRMMQESGPMREQAAQLLGMWAQRLLGGAASELWSRLGY